MLARNDIQILKEIFATKEELYNNIDRLEKKMEKKMEKNTAIIVKEIHSIIDLLIDPKVVINHEQRIQKLEGKITN